MQILSKTCLECQCMHITSAIIHTTGYGQVAVTRFRDEMQILTLFLFLGEACPPREPRTSEHQKNNHARTGHLPISRLPARILPSPVSAMLVSVDLTSLVVWKSARKRKALCSNQQRPSVCTIPHHQCQEVCLNPASISISSTSP